MKLGYVFIQKTTLIVLPLPLSHSALDMEDLELQEIGRVFFFIIIS